MPSVEAFFTSLSKQQTMLLLTAVTFGGQDALPAFDHLGGELAEVIQHRAQEMLQIPREQRIPLLVQEIKRLVTAKKGYLWASDPEKLAKVLRRERPALVEVILRALPAQVADAVRKNLPPSNLNLRKDVKPEILNVVRWKLEEVLARTVSPKATFRFADVLLLQSRELLTLCDRIGARGLAAAVAGLSEAERDGFLTALTPDLKAMVVKAMEASPGRKLDPGDAQELIHHHAEGKGPVQAIRSAGAHRLARACLAQSPEFAARVVDRHKGDLGALLSKWLREERAKGQPKGDAGRAEVVLELERLAEAGVIDRPVRLTPPRTAGPPRPAGIPPPRAPAGSIPPKAGQGRRGPQEIPMVGVKQEKPVLGPPRMGPGLRSKGPPPPAEEARPKPSRYRDPIAERQARRAGAIPSHPPPEPPASRERSQVTQPPLRSRLPSERPRSVIKPGGRPPPKRGPRGH